MLFVPSVASAVVALVRLRRLHRRRQYRRRRRHYGDGFLPPNSRDVHFGACCIGILLDSVWSHEPGSAKHRVLHSNLVVVVVVEIPLYAVATVMMTMVVVLPRILPRSRSTSWPPLLLRIHDRRGDDDDDDPWHSSWWSSLVPRVSFGAQVCFERWYGSVCSLTLLPTFDRSHGTYHIHWWWYTTSLEYGAATY